MSSSRPEAKKPGALRVLVIEDNEDAADSLADLLDLSGHEVRVAFDGQSGIAMAGAFRPDVVISDIGLPGACDGYAVARAVRGLSALDGACLIALSGYANAEAKQRSRDAGFDLHLAKPPDLQILERALADVGRRRTEAGQQL